LRGKGGERGRLRERGGKEGRSNLDRVVWVGKSVRSNRRMREDRFGGREKVGFWKGRGKGRRIEKKDRWEK